MSLDKMPVFKMPVDERPVDEMSVDKMWVDEMSVDAMPVDKMSVDKISVDKMSVDKMSLDNTLEKLECCLQTSWLSADVKLMKIDLVHAMTWQCMFALSMIILQYLWSS